MLAIASPTECNAATHVHVQITSRGLSLHFAVARAALEQEQDRNSSAPSPATSSVSFEVLPPCAASVLTALCDFVSAMAATNLLLASGRQRPSELLPRCAWSHGLASVIGGAAWRALLAVFDAPGAAGGAAASTTGSESTAVRRGVVAFGVARQIGLCAIVSDCILWEIARRGRLCSDDAEVLAEFGFEAAAPFSADEVNALQQVAPQLYEEKAPVTSSASGSAAAGDDGDEEDEEDDDDDGGAASSHAA